MDEAEREWFEERTGILEYEAGLTRPEAEAKARAWLEARRAEVASPKAVAETLWRGPEPDQGRESRAAAVAVDEAQLELFG